MTEAGVTLRGWGGAAHREGPAWGRGSGSRWAGATAESTKGEERLGEVTGEPSRGLKAWPQGQENPRGRERKKQRQCSPPREC